MRRCQYKYRSYAFEWREPCQHSCWRDSSFCIFHHPDWQAKSEEFDIEFESFLVSNQTNSTIGSIDAEGFVFNGFSFGELVIDQAISFREACFKEGANFDETVFRSSVDFSHSVFSGYADFRESFFNKDAYFISCNFKSNSNFDKSTFLQRSDFNRSIFNLNARFDDSSFMGPSYFEMTKFLDYISFRQTRFSQFVDFYQSVFSSDADFKLCHFAQRVSFQQAVFHDEVFFDTAHFAFLKHPPGQTEANGTVSLKGAVLEAAHLWGIDTLTRYDLRDAFVLGVSLAGKALVDCDFTGAVLKNIHTDGWQPDAQTLANTRYIYTDYEVVEEPDEDGTVRQVYRPLEESRVPADGEFGDADNPGFTLATYLSTPYRWNRALKFPRKLRQALLDYLNGFQHYAETIAGVEDLEVHPFKEGREAIRLEFEIPDESQKDEIQALFREYVQHAFRPVDRLRETLVFRNPDLSEQEKAIFFADYEEQIAITQRKAANRYQQIAATERPATVQRLAELGGGQVILIQNILDSTLSANQENRQMVRVHIENRHLAANDVNDLRDEVERLAQEHEAWRKAYADELEAEFKDLRADLKDREVPDSEAKSRWVALRQRLAQIADKVAGDGRSAEAWLDIAEKIGNHFG